MKPTFYLIAGPNGTGKSTAAYQLTPQGVEYINSDDIARQVRERFEHQEVVLQRTNEEAQRRIFNKVRERKSFSVETNLADESTWRFFRGIQQSGYSFELLFLCTSSIATLVKRVRQRHLDGGHFVREDVIRERYGNGLYFLNRFFDEPDSISLFDTSEGVRMVYKRIGQEVVFEEKPFPDWMANGLTTRFKASAPSTPQARDARTTDEVRDLYRNSQTRLPGDFSLEQLPE